MVLLPWELEEDILSRLPPQSLVRFRSVCKRWKSLFDEKSFINNHFARVCPQFIFMTKSNFYSIEIIGLDGVDPTIKLRVLDFSGIPYREWKFVCITITACDGFLFCNSWTYPLETAFWNPWLNQVKWIEYEDIGFNVCGLGYDNTRDEKVYKILGSFMCRREERPSYDYHPRVSIYDCASHAFKFIETPNRDWFLGDVQRYSVSLNGNLYWVPSIPNTDDFLIQCFDFSREICKPFCLLPCRKFDSSDLLVLQIFKGHKLSLLKQCYKTRKVEIWVTKKKIDTSNNSEEEVVWINLLTFPPSNVQNLFKECYGISYFIYDKTTLIIFCVTKKLQRLAFTSSGEICSRSLKLIIRFSFVITVFMLPILSPFL
ncbi:unnamed protein product [Arabidopsis lyrata]|nr:unnamed protein product [Arabidopsis lyrata]